VLLSIAHSVSVCLFFFSRLLVTAFFVAAILVWFFLRENLILDLGYLNLFVPYLLLFASSAALLIEDFNFPVRDVVIEALLLPTLTALIIIGGGQIIGLL